MVISKYVITLVIGTIFGINTVGADEAAIRQGISKLRPDMKIEQVTESPIPGIYEVTTGAMVFYASADGRYILQGNLIDLVARKDLTDAKLAQIKKAALDKIPESSMIVFAPEQVKHTITVFTDIDCSFCRKLHREIADFMREGIKVRYLFYPRAGINSATYDKSVSIWCAKDRQQAMTDAKSGNEIPKLTCDNPVQQHMHLGEVMGVTGTPSIILEDGSMLPGYMPAAQMAMHLNGSNK